MIALGVLVLNCQREISIKPQEGTPAEGGETLAEAAGILSLKC